MVVGAYAKLLCLVPVRVAALVLAAQFVAEGNLNRDRGSFEWLSQRDRRGFPEGL